MMKGKLDLFVWLVLWIQSVTCTKRNEIQANILKIKAQWKGFIKVNKGN